MHFFQGYAILYMYNIDDLLNVLPKEDFCTSWYLHLAMVCLSWSFDIFILQLLHIVCSFCFQYKLPVYRGGGITNAGITRVHCTSLYFSSRFNIQTTCKHENQSRELLLKSLVVGNLYPLTLRIACRYLFCK